MNDFPREKVMEAYRAAPAPIQEAFGSVRTVELLKEVRERYGLHIDTAGTIGKEVGYLLLGLINPMEFTGRLVAGGVDGSKVANIVEDINREIFVPLRDRMRNPEADTQPEEGSEEESVAQKWVETTSPPVREPASPLTETPAYAPPPPPPAPARAIAPPVPLPGQPQEERQWAPPAPQPPTPPVPPPAPTEEKPLVKEYSVDPYREPVD